MKTTQIIEKFAQQISELPMVQELIQQENQRIAAETYAGRVKCLAQLRVARDQEVAACTDVEMALVALRQAEEELTPLRMRVNIASRKAAELSEFRHSLDFALQNDYGEAFVSRALYILKLWRDQRAESIKNLTLSLNPAVLVDDRIEFRFVDPKTRGFIELEKKKLAALDGAYAAANKLIEIDLSPERIKERVQALLASVGCPPNLIQMTDTPLTV